MTSRVRELAESVILQVLARLAMIVSTLVLVVGVPVASWWAEKVWTSMEQGVASSHRIELSLQKQTGRIDLLESRQNDLSFRIDRIELRPR